MARYRLADSAQWAQLARWKIAGFTLISVIGEGGMGIVHRAEQERPRRSVAPKLLRHGFTSPRQTRRFEVEAKALARLRHPGIAQIHEAGAATLAGVIVPYIAMELVDGMPLIEHVRATRLNPRDTLELFVRVCDAVQHAHARGVIHRDLKPSNILVEPSADGIGQPRILDFGVARIVDEDDPGMLTMPGLMVGTIAAMSPEQLREGGSDIDTRCDVYALGVLLYDLLAGAPPHDLAGRGILEAARIVRDEEPVRLGLRCRACRGDLELIVATAMAKDRERRYASAAALADDVRRFLRVEPIVARRPAGAYVFLRFLQRHRLTVGVGAALAVAIAALSFSALRAHEREVNANTLAAGRTAALLNFVGELIKEARVDRRTLATIPLGKSLEVISAKLIANQVAPGERWDDARTSLDAAKAVCDADSALESTQVPFAVAKGFLRWARAQSRWDECDRYLARSMAEARAHPGRASVSLVSAELEAGITSHRRGELAAAERWLLTALDECNQASEYRPINATRVLRELCDVLEAQPNGSAEDLARYQEELRVAWASVEGSMTPLPK